MSKSQARGSSRQTTTSASKRLSPPAPKRGADRSSAVAVAPRPAAKPARAPARAAASRGMTPLDFENEFGSWCVSVDHRFPVAVARVHGDVVEVRGLR